MDCIFYIIIIRKEGNYLFHTYLVIDTSIHHYIILFTTNTNELSLTRIKIIFNLYYPC